VRRRAAVLPGEAPEGEEPGPIPDAVCFRAAAPVVTTVDGYHLGAVNVPGPRPWRFTEVGAATLADLAASGLDEPRCLKCSRQPRRCMKCSR
jgi:hypothetical protein